MSESSEPPSPLNEEPKDAAASAISNTLHKEEPAVDEHRVEEDSEDDDQTEVGDDEDGPSSPGVGESSPMTASVATTTATPSSARKSSIHKKTPSSHKRRRSSTASTTSTPSKRNPSHSQPNLELPFRTVKKAMKLDPDTPIVQVRSLYFYYMFFTIQYSSYFDA